VTKGNVAVKLGKKKIAVVTPHHFIGEMAFLNYSLAGESESASAAATADAIVDDDEGVAWVWDFEELRMYLKGEREVSNALSAYINHDLRTKLAKAGISMTEID
jgi:hypothetical protein